MTTFTIPGTPKGQGRPRFGRAKAGFVTVHDPKESRDWKQTVAATALAAGVRGQPGCFRLCIYAYLPRPKRLCRKKDEPIPVWAACRPDVDNIFKGVADALEGVAYANDSQVVDGWCKKMYHEIGGMPRTVVQIEVVT